MLPLQKIAKSLSLCALIGLPCFAKSAEVNVYSYRQPQLIKPIFDVFTQELRLTGESGNLQYQLGMYYYEDELNFWQASNNILNFPVDDSTSFAGGALPANVACGLLGSTPNPGWLAKGLIKCYFPLAATYALNNQDTESTSFFINFNYAISDQLEIGVGARRIEEEKDFDTQLDLQVTP